MGFFSSRRHDTNSTSNSPGAQPQSSPSSPAGIIRARFSSRNKGKARDANLSLSRGTASPLAESRKEPIFDDTSRTINGRRTTNDSGEGVASELSSLQSPSPQQPSGPGPANPRVSTDATTVVLAQRLAELASANAEGLLDDDEYRLLRQNLFERFGSSTMSQKKPDSIAGPARPQPHETHKRSNSLRSPSLQSKGTISSSVSGLFRRPSKRNISTDTDTLHSDSTSLLSTGSNSPNTFTHRLLRLSLQKKSSLFSLRLDGTTTGHGNGSTVHIADTSRSDGPSNSITLSRSSTTRSRRGTPPPPPSSFHHRVNGLDQRRVQPGILDDDLDDELKSSREIRAQIEAVEAEGRRLMDAFNGLELTALTRKSQSNHIATLPSTTHFLQGLDSFDHAWSSQSSQDPDVASMRSTTSNGTNLSAYRSPVWSPRSTQNMPLVSQPVSLGRKSSLSSISSKGRSGAATTTPYLPALPSSLGRLLSGSSSSINLIRSTSHLPLAPVAEGDNPNSMEAHHRHLHLDTSSALLRSTPASPRKNGAMGDDWNITELEAEMAEIRRRRAEVMARYEERLGYLRAKLKGAELHEKLLRR
ncbi:hypothetical protein F5148DRAFT_902383 [Russula earlei]|uniref:Uncharacterized protein n=1 Tax=Russula earlei TaxID=71964 RepID=A0ACC0UMX6_9AGAM|nr:hypothetical protein F5148DRAFT_902383 [Russula earlei]